MFCRYWILGHTIVSQSVSTCIPETRQHLSRPDQQRPSALASSPEDTMQSEGPKVEPWGQTCGCSSQRPEDDKGAQKG